MKEVQILVTKLLVQQPHRFYCSICLRYQAEFCIEVDLTFDRITSGFDQTTDISPQLHLPPHHARNHISCFIKNNHDKEKRNLNSLGSEMALHLVSHNMTSDGAAAYKTNNLVKVIPHSATNSSGSTPLNFDLLIFSKLTSTSSRVDLSNTRDSIEVLIINIFLNEIITVYERTYLFLRLQMEPSTFRSSSSEKFYL